MYLINEISNRDLSLLYSYRILRQPSDFISAIYSGAEPLVTEIFEGEGTQFKDEDDSPLYAFNLDINLDNTKIPYLEFDATTDYDKKHLETLLYLEDNVIYGKSATFSKPIQVKIYLVDSLETIRKAIDSYIEEISMLDLSKLKEAYEQKKNQPKGVPNINGNDSNLVQYANSDGKLSIKDTGYTITSALDAQLLVNPSQELLMTLPSKLKHNINISITDGGTRYLSAFSGYTINIKGNGNWVMRDVDSGINFVNGSGKIYLWNCKLVHFRNSIEDNASRDVYRCSYLHAHRSLVILNQGSIDELYLVGGSTLIEVPHQTPSISLGTKINKVMLIGHGCALYSWMSAIAVDPTHILGLAWWCNITTKDTVLYVAGRRIDEVSGEHDAELQPSQILEYDVDNIHIKLGGN